MSRCAGSGRASAPAGDYDRLNIDYRELHHLARFFLAYLSSDLSDQAAGAPFTLDMAHLFERFVARRLRAALPNHLRLVEHERLDLGSSLAPVGRRTAGIRRVRTAQDFFELPPTSVSRGSRNDPKLGSARRWRFRMNMDLESFRSHFEKFSRASA